MAFSTSESTATLVLLDGAIPGGLEHLAANVDTPNISRILLDRGATVPATTVFQCSGHGGQTHDRMRCVIAANRVIEGPMRSTDALPVILSHLGYAIPDGIDGRHAAHSVALAAS